MTEHSTIGSLLFALRGSRSQSSVAEAAGVARPFLSDVENDKARPSARWLACVLIALEADEEAVSLAARLHGMSVVEEVERLGSDGAAA